MSQYGFEDNVRVAAQPLVTFRNYVFPDVIASFGDIDKRAHDLIADHINQSTQRAIDPANIDHVEIGEAAHEYGIGWWETMIALRQSMVNLLSAGLFHLFEQQLAVVRWQWPLRDQDPVGSSFKDIVDWFDEVAEVDITKLPSWNAIDELRLVANTVKHGEGSSARQLRGRRPLLFVEPLSALDEDIETSKFVRRAAHVVIPLSGDDFFVTEDILREYSMAAESFFEELASVFESRE